ncbi:MAG: penicillin acylase family protein [Acidimicrobiia bacterium]
MVVAVGLIAAACSGDEPEAEAEAEETTPDIEQPDDTTPATTPDTEPDDAPADTTTTTTEAPAPAITEDRAYYILPPGNYGGLPTTDESTDQLALYDGLTPLRDAVTDADIEEHFLPMDFEPVGETTEEPTPRDDVTILYDEFGVAHVTGETREAVAFGAGWVTARDRGLLIDLGRGPARAAIADVPGINAFSLVTSAQAFVPSAATEQLVTDQVQLLIDTFGEEGEQIVADAQAYADGLTAYWEANDLDREPATVNDVIATTAFIGSIFGAGGGGEAGNAEFLAALQSRLGDEQGRLVWEDFLQVDDPEAPTTIEERFEYPVLTGGEVTGSVELDEGSVIGLDPREPAPGSTPIVNAALYDPTDGPEFLTASNWLTVDPSVSTNETTLAVMGPQLGYYYPEIVQQIRLSGPGIEVQGAAVPGLAMYILIGRTPDYAWSLTSANQDVRDVYAEILCEPDGSEPTRESGHYEYEGACIPFEPFDAGTLGGVPIVYPVSVHGPVIGTATVDGAPVALTSKRSTFGRDALNLGALKDMTEGDAATPEAFFEAANKFGFTFNWGYANRDDIAYFASGYLPERPAGLDRRLPTLGTGEYEWEGFLDLEEHPHAVGHPSGRLLNWNNQSAPGFAHGDDNQYGSVHRVEAFDQWPDRVDLAGVVGVMNRSATEDVRSTVWPVIRDVLGDDASSPLAEQAVAIVDAWIADDAPLLDADDDGRYDEAGAVIFDGVFPAVADAVVRPVLGDWPDDVGLRGVGLPSVVDKDLRRLLGADVEGPFAVAYCGAGDIDTCRADLWEAIDGAVAAIAAEQGDDPSAWRTEGDRTTFVPGLIPDDFRATNRPTFQQVIEFAPADESG